MCITNSNQLALLNLNLSWMHIKFLLFVCLFLLRFNVQVTNFSVMSGRSHHLLGITSTFGE